MTITQQNVDPAQERVWHKRRDGRNDYYKDELNYYVSGEPGCVNDLSAFNWLALLSCRRDNGQEID
jgi:hypothetical protein